MSFVPNIEALKQAVKSEKLAALICMSPENFAYASGAFILTVSLIRPRQAYAVIPAQGEPFLVICSIEESLTKAESWIKEIHCYTEFVHNPIDALTEVLKAKGITRGRVGIDLDYLPATSLDRLKSNLPEISLANTTEDIARIRVIKTPEEVAHLEKTTKQTHRAVLDAMAASKLGDTERMMADRIANNIINYGADGTLFMCFASGPRTPQSHGHATERVPVESEIIRFDVGGTYGAWASDFARTYSTGNPTAMQREFHRKLCECEEATINAVKPGVPAEDLFYLCRDEFKKRNIPFHMPHIGHSFGVELHENPMLRPGDKTPLKPGMVLNIEPAVKDEAGHMYHTEDLVLVTDTGFRLLTLGLAPKEIPVIGVKVM